MEGLPQVEAEGNWRPRVAGIDLGTVAIRETWQQINKANLKAILLKLHEQETSSGS